ncbi:phosphate uptake regulator PhoU [Candidatus Woesearchaeota archaeon]|nr:phosphate uptake regulator PhoU [Candidatus Woesearchaeota archaeon]
MEMRKIVSFGNSSYVVTLPKAWVTKNGLRKGDTLTIDERPYELVLSARGEGKKKRSETTINCEGKTLRELKTELIAAYVNNSNIITLKGANIKDLSATIKPIIYGLVGVEVIEETSSSIVVKDLLEISEVSIDDIVRRMDLLVKSMLEDSTHRDKIESVQERDKEVNRLALLAARLFRAATDNPGILKTFNTNYWDLLMARHITVQLEHEGDYVKRVAKLLNTNNSRKNSGEESRRIYSQLAARYKEAMKVYYSKDKPASYKMESDTKRFMQECDKVIEKNRDATTVRVIENLKQMTKSIMYILRTVMEHE